MSASPGRQKFQVSFQISPIILTGGIALLAGGSIPIVSLTQAKDYDLGILAGAQDVDLDSFFAHFNPAASTDLIDNEVSLYPFANQATAANSIVTKPLRISLTMIIPVQGPGGYGEKLQVMTALKASLDKHNNQGGTYTVATPAFYYTDCLLTNLRDISGGDPRQPQMVWQWDFLQPLITLAAAAQAQNTLMSKLSSQTKLAGDPPGYSGPDPSAGDPASGTANRVVPAAQGPAGASVNGANSDSSVFYGVSRQGGPNPTPSTRTGGPGTFVPAGANG